jgi:Na+/melibiose symporter-like transporter
MRESGYFLPHVVIGYGFTVIAALVTWPTLYYVFGIRNAVITLGAMVAVAVLFGIWFVRYSKVLWLALDLTLHPPHSEDFEARGRRE